MTASLPAVVLLDKKEGETSFRALGNVKRHFGTRKVGHTGTLDPMATGLLVALVGSATRCARYFNGLDKVYRAEITFGEETSTDDRTGDVVTRCAPPPISAIEQVLPEFLGRISQVPPAYSALHVNGERAYKRARAGEAVLLAARDVTIKSLDVETIEESRLQVRIVCSSGTYVRSLARDIGRRLESAAHLSALRRTEVGAFSVDEVNPDGDGNGTALSLPAALPRLPGFARAEVTAEEARAMQNGGKVCRDGPDAESALDHLLATRNGEPIAIGTWRSGCFEYEMVFPQEQTADSDQSRGADG